MFQTLLVCASLIALVASSSTAEVFSAAAYREARVMHAEATGCATDATYCGSHGRCVGSSCVCTSDHWTGATCSSCATGWAASDCNTECRGGSCNACNGHGTCNQDTTGDGSCVCFSSDAKGYWAGVDCTQCATDYFGYKCNTPCPGVLVYGVACWGRGTCAADVLGDGYCVCNTGWGSASGCEDCDDSHYGSSCSLACVGFTGSKPCSGNGRCFNGTSGNGTCVCDTGYGGADCKTQCPGGGTCSGHGTCRDGSSNDATCVCQSNFQKPDCMNCIFNMTGWPTCEYHCLAGDNGLICSGNGNCTYDTLNGVGCSCAPGYTGPTCQLSCPGNPPCSGNGVCNLVNGELLCTCFDDNVHGHWTGATCSQCNSLYNSSNCSVACPIGTGGLACSGHGNCIDGKCYCTRSLSIEYCQSACQLSSVPGATNSDGSCSACACLYCTDAGVYGANCDSPCPGRSTGIIPTSCNNHGYCDEGRSGRGTCSCLFGFAGPQCNLKCANNSAGEICSTFAHGTCTYDSTTSSAVCSCRAQYAGTACQISCPINAGLVCSGNGVCNNGVRGDGTCKCATGWTGRSCGSPCSCDSKGGTCNNDVCAAYTSSDNCKSCICTGNYTGLCDVCKLGYQGDSCEGLCVHGRTVGKTCVCDSLWATASCTVHCPIDNVTNSVCGGHGTCLEGNSQPGTCSCISDYYSTTCTVHCTIDGCRATTKFANPQCNSATGNCECQDNSQGHWEGSTCSVCKSGYWGPSCNEACNCNSHGSCDMNTGECQCFASADQGYYSGSDCSSCATGYIGLNCEHQNILITRLQRVNESYYPLSVNTEASTLSPVPTPSPTVLLVDSSAHSLMVGGIPTYSFDVSQTTGMLLQLSSTSSSACVDEPFLSWQDSTYNYFLMQASPTCNTPVRVLRVKQDAKSLDFGGMQRVWAWGQLNTTVRIVAANGTAKTAPSAIVVLALAQFSGVAGQGVQYAGGYIIRVDVVQYLTRSDAAFQLQLPSTFLVHDVSLAFMTDSTGTLVETAAVAGDLSGVWEVYLYKAASTGYVAFVGSTAALSSKVQCWPAPGSGLNGGGAFSDYGTATTTCQNCVSARKVTFWQSSIIIALFVKSSSDNRTIMAMLRPFSELKSQTVTWGQPVSSSTCSVALYLSGQISGINGDSTAFESLTNTPYYAQVADSDTSGTDATAMAIDGAALVLYVAFQVANGAGASLLTKFSMDSGNFTLYGTRQLNYVTTNQQTVPEKFSALGIDPATRLLYALGTGLSQVRVVTFLLYEVFSITPSIADQRGGTSILVRGRGFQQIINSTTLLPQYPVTCDVSGQSIVTATNISFNYLTCVMPAVDNISSTSSACSGQALEVSMYGSQWFTQNNVALKRVQSPHVASVDPSRGGLAGNVLVTVYGQGFVQSSYSRCSFWSDNPLSPETLYSTLTYVTPNMATCVQPKASFPSFDDSFLNVSIDGQLWAEQGPVPYQIVGLPTNLSSIASLTMKAAAVSAFSINVTVVDSQQHFLGSLDTVKSRSICIFPNVTNGACDDSQFSWRSQTDGYPWPPCRNNTLEFSRNYSALQSAYCRNTANSLVVFDDLVFRNPRSTTLSLVFYSGDTTLQWSSVTSIVIEEGAAYALAISNRNDLTSVTIVNGQALSPSPEIIVIDVLGNVLQKVASNLIVTAQSYYIMDSDGQRFETNSYTLTPTQGSNVIRFSQIFLKYIHGANHWIDFTSTPSLVSARSPPLRTSLCDNPKTMYKVVNTSDCAACPEPGAVCNGTEIIQVLPGYWRGNTSTYIYLCPAGPFVCLGSQDLKGSTCAYGYTDTLCGNCIDGYGHAGGTGCGPCKAFYVNLIAVVAAAIGFLAALLIWTTVTLRSPDVTDLTVIIRTVVNHMQATGKLGEFSSQWDPFLKSVFAVQDSASSVSVSSITTLDCLLRQTNNDYGAVFTAYMLLPIVSVFMAFGVFVVVRVLKMKPVINDELKAEVKEDLKNIGPGARTAILLQRYPFYMVATVTFSVNMFAMYQTLITQSTSVLSCSTYVIADGVSQSYLDVDMTIKCTPAGDHRFRTAAMFCAIIYGFGIPAAFFFGFKFMNGRLGKPALTKAMFMFLIGGYKDEYWYWQLVIMVRKMVLVLIIVFVGGNTELQSYCGMWTMTVALIAQIWFQPNDKAEFNMVEAQSLAIITITLNLGLLYFWPDMPDAGKNILTATLIAITFGVLLMFAYFMYGPIKETVQLTLETFVDKAKDLTEKAANPNADEPEKKNTYRAVQMVYDDDDSDDEVGELSGRRRPAFAVNVNRVQRKVEPRFEEMEEMQIKEEPSKVSPPRRATKPGKPLTSPGSTSRRGRDWEGL